jgi:hypothetical protein
MTELDLRESCPVSREVAGGRDRAATSSRPTEWSRLRLRARFEWRKVNEGWRQLYARFWPPPWIRGLLHFWIARAEVRSALRRSEKALAIARLPDRLGVSDIPSQAGNRQHRPVLAKLDQDGFAHATNPVDCELFNRREAVFPRVRYQLDVVVHDGSVCVRKQFCRQPLTRGLRHWLWSLLGQSFYNEAAALLRLRGLPCVPQLRKIDRRRRAIYVDYIPGESLRHKLGGASGVVHDLDIAGNPQLSRLTDDERSEREIALFTAAATPQLRESIRHHCCVLASRGVLPLDIKPGNLIVGQSTGNLYWIDFELAHLESYWGWKEALEEHRRLVNRWFGAGLVTCERVREFKWAGSDGHVYSPVDLGELGWVGDISDVERGEGRWRWLLRDLVNWKGKRILDLGANNCLYAIRELQRGAEEVHCVELNPDACEAARFLKQAVEQTDSSTLNIHIHYSDIHSFLTHADFPCDHFDITMALCSIYYLSREQIAECMKIISRISKVCWLQGNSETEREDADLFERASQEFLEGQLRDAGFSDVTVIAPECYRKTPRQYHRPLLIGRKPPTAKAELDGSCACVG